jgi:hypothetical protein
MKSILLWLATSILTAAGWSSLVLAHSAGGQTFVMVNGEYVKANPIAGISPALPEDLAPRSLAVGQAVELAVDRGRFGQPENRFRWQWSENAQGYAEGDTVRHTYDAPGTYIARLQLKSNESGSFADLATIGINILPRAESPSPEPRVIVTQLGSDAKGYQVRLEVEGKEGSSELVEYEWKFGDGISGKGRSVERRYEGREFDVYPWLRVKDVNGVVKDVAFELFGDGKKVQVADVPELEGVASLSTKGGRNATPVLVAAVLTILAAGAWWAARRMKRGGRG